MFDPGRLKYNAERRFIRAEALLRLAEKHKDQVEAHFLLVLRRTTPGIKQHEARDRLMEARNEEGIVKDAWDLWHKAHSFRDVAKLRKTIRSDEYWNSHRIGEGT